MTMTSDDAFSGWHPSARRFLEGAEQKHRHLVIKLRRSSNGRAQVDGVEHRFVYHSPDGFEWGYGGSGPADLALNILGMLVPPEEAWRLHHQFKFDVLAGIDRDPPEGAAIDLPMSLVIGWLRGTWHREEQEGTVPA